MSVKILLVEDNAENRYLATFLLESHGFEVLHAINGKDALAEAQRALPDLILMDIHMPEMDGYEAARVIREEKTLSGIPMVAMTSYAQAGDRERALALGFVGYLEKPICTQSFVSQIQSFFSGKAGVA